MVKGSTEVINTTLIISHIILIGGFGVQLINSLLENKKDYLNYIGLSMISFSFLMSFITSLFNDELDAIYKLIYLILFALTSGTLFIKLNNIETFCPTTYEVPADYKRYYQKVMNRNQNLLLPEYQKAYGGKKSINNTNIMPLQNNYFKNN